MSNKVKLFELNNRRFTKIKLCQDNTQSISGNSAQLQETIKNLCRIWHAINLKKII